MLPHLLMRPSDDQHTPFTSPIAAHSNTAVTVGVNYLRFLYLI